MKNGIKEFSRGNKERSNQDSLDLRSASEVRSSHNSKYNKLHYTNDLIARKILIAYDYEGLYSFTHLNDANTISLIILNNFENNKNLKILDGTGGLGGNTMSFCKYFLNVHTFEIDKERFTMLKTNIENLNFHNIYLYNKDSIDYMLVNYENFDVYFFDPPWGGPDYKKSKLLSLKMNEYNLGEIAEIIMKKTNDKLLVFKLPFNYDLNEFNLFNYKLYKIHNYFIIIILL
jgi:tRNA/tmRNA/rRNA uracil-C5-methylase (TrmA/RlmC/RlmD family)